MNLPLNCTLLCASGAANDINPVTGQYTPDPVFSKAVAYSTDPAPISADQINACLVGRTASGIIVAFRGTLPPEEPDSYLDIRYENYGDLVPLLPPADELNSLLAKAVAYIPDIGTELSKLISTNFGAWLECY